MSSNIAMHKNWTKSWTHSPGALLLRRARFGDHLPEPFYSPPVDESVVWVCGNGGNEPHIADGARTCAMYGIHVPKPNLFLDINENVDDIIRGGTPENIADIAWSYGTLGFYAPNVFEAIEKHCHRLVADKETDRERTQYLSNTAIGFAKVGIQSKIFFNFFRDFIPVLMKDGDPEAIANVCYSFAILDLVHEYKDEFLQLWNHSTSLDPKSITDEGLKQLYMAFFYVSATGLDIQRPPLIPPGIYLKQQFRSFYYGQQEVSRYLEELGYHAEMDVCPLKPEMKFDGVCDNFLAIDVACKDQMIAVECDGPSRFLKTAGTEGILSIEKGPTKAKRCFLERLGWTVINLHYEWHFFYPQRQKEYFLQKLKAAGVGA